MEIKKARHGREEWRKRVERWRASGQSAEVFAAELGTRPATLRFWKYRLGAESRGGEKTREKGVKASALVEVRGLVTAESAPFVLELSPARRLQIPSTFNEQALERVLSVLERR